MLDEYKEDYEIFELIEMLKADDSWESDPEMREMLADSVYFLMY